MAQQIRSFKGRGLQQQTETTIYAKHSECSWVKSTGGTKNRTERKNEMKKKKTPFDHCLILIQKATNPAGKVGEGIQYGPAVKILVLVTLLLL